MGFVKVEDEFEGGEDWQRPTAAKAAKSKELSILVAEITCAWRGVSVDRMRQEHGGKTQWVQWSLY